jgi:hypothetical protein
MGLQAIFNRVMRDIERHAMRMQLRVKRPALVVKKLSANNVAGDTAFVRVHRRAFTDASGRQPLGGFHRGGY